MKNHLRVLPNETEQSKEYIYACSKTDSDKGIMYDPVLIEKIKNQKYRKRSSEKIKQLEQNNVLLREKRLNEKRAWNKKAWEKTKQLEQDNVSLREERLLNQRAKNKNAWEKTKQLEQDNLSLREERLLNQRAKNKNAWEKTKQLEQENVLLREDCMINTTKMKSNRSTIDSTSFISTNSTQPRHHQINLNCKCK